MLNQQTTEALYVSPTATEAPEEKASSGRPASPAEPRPRKQKAQKTTRSKASTDKKNSATASIPAEKPPEVTGHGKSQPRKKGKNKRQTTQKTSSPLIEEAAPSQDPAVTVSDPSEPMEKKQPPAKKGRAPLKLEIRNYDPMALSFLNRLLNTASQFYKRMALIGINAGHILFRELYGFTPTFEPVWNFIATDQYLYDDFLGALQKALSNPKGIYSYRRYARQGIETISIDKKLENGLVKELITFKLYLSPKKTMDLRNASIPPFNKLSIHSPEKQIEILEAMFRISSTPSFEYHQFLSLWRHLEEVTPKLSSQASKKLFQMGRDLSLAYGESPVRDEVIRQSLPAQRPEDHYFISDTSAIPEELICQVCTNPLFHSLRIPCGNKLCRICVVTSDRDASGRLICRAKDCQGAHYAFDYQRDAYTIKALREYAEPESLIPIPDDPTSVMKSLIVLTEQTNRLTNALPFISLRNLSKITEEPVPSAEACQSVRKNLEERAGEAVPRNLHERGNQLLPYHQALSEFAHCHQPLLNSASSGAGDSDRNKRIQITHNILNHSYSLATGELALLDAYLESETPGELSGLLAHLVIAIDSAMVHIDHLSLLEHDHPVIKSAIPVQLLTDFPRPFYPELLDKLKRLHENNLLLNTIETERQQENLDHTLRVILQLFPFMLEEPQRSILFHQASSTEITTALLQHMTLISRVASPLDYHSYWEKLLPILLEMGEDPFPPENTLAFGEIMNLLARQIEIFNNSLTGNMVLFPPPERQPVISDIILLLERFLSDFVPRYSRWASQPDWSGIRDDYFHPWVRAPEEMSKALDETRQKLLENKARADQFRQGQQQLWETQRRELLTRDHEARAQLMQIQKYAALDNGKERFPLAWEGVSQFSEHLDVLEEAVALSHRLKQLRRHTPPATPMVDYRHPDPAELLDITRQLLDHIQRLYQPMISTINHYSRSVQVLLSEKNKAMLLESVEHIELMETSINHLRNAVANIRSGLGDSHQTVADWLKSKVGFSPDFMPIKLMAQLAHRMVETRKQVNSIFSGVNVFAAWLEVWNRVVDDADFPIPITSSRRDKRDYLNIVNHLPGDYNVLWVAADGNCLYSALLMGITPGHQHPTPDQTAAFRKKLHLLLVKIVDMIRNETHPEKQKKYWQQLATLLSLSQEGILALIDSGSTLNPVSPEMLHTVPANYGEMAFIAPLAMLSLNTSVSYMDISNPLAPESWIQHHENIFSAWLHNAPELLGALIEADIVDITQIEHGDELSLALLSQNQEEIQQVVDQYSITSSPFIIIHTGSSHNSTGHFFAASTVNFDSQAAQFQQYMLDSLNVSSEQLQGTPTMVAAAALMIVQQLKSSQ